MTALRLLVAVVLLEAACLLAVGVGYGIVTVTSDAGDRGPAYAESIAAVVVSGLLVGLAWSIRQGRGWARTPVGVLNVFPLPLAVDAFRSGAWPVAVPLLTLAVAVLALLARTGADQD